MHCRCTFSDPPISLSIYPPLIPYLPTFHHLRLLSKTRHFRLLGLLLYVARHLQVDQTSPHLLLPLSIRLAGTCLLAALYCGLDQLGRSAVANFPDFEAYKVDMPPWSDVPTEKDAENLLQRSENKFLNQIQGPESIAFDPAGRGPYTGVADSRVLFWDGESWKYFAYTSGNRPLGLGFNKRTGDLYIADAYFGLMKVGPEGGLAASLATEAEGVPLRFTNDLDVDEEGNVYFTDSSTKYQRRNFMQLVFSAEDSGRLLKYNPTMKETTVLMRNIQFPNGVSLGKDGSFLVFSEFAIGRLRKFWLKGEKARTSEAFAVLPGFPDNVRANKDGDFWVAIHCRRSMYFYYSSLYPKLRKLWLKLPISAKTQLQFQIGGRPHAVVVKYSPEGKLVQILEDSERKVVRSVSEVEEKDGKLWIGSVLMPFVAVYSLS